MSYESNCRFSLLLVIIFGLGLLGGFALGINLTPEEQETEFWQPRIQFRSFTLNKTDYSYFWQTHLNVTNGYLPDREYFVSVFSIYYPYGDPRMDCRLEVYIAPSNTLTYEAIVWDLYDQSDHELYPSEGSSWVRWYSNVSEIYVVFFGYYSDTTGMNLGLEARTPQIQYMILNLYSEAKAIITGGV